MKHSWQINTDMQTIMYNWKHKGVWHSFDITTETTLQDIALGSQEEFITEHYWGYTKIKEQKTSEYGVAHPRWQIYKTQHYNIDVNFGSNYGAAFSFLDHAVPNSVFLAEGSAIEVKEGGRV